MMTIRQTVDALQWWLEHNKQRGCDVLDGNLKAAIQDAVKHLHESDRFGWHDADKELPDDQERVLVLCEYYHYGDKNRMETEFDIDCQIGGMWLGCGVKYKVLKWKRFRAPEEENV